MLFVGVVAAAARGQTPDRQTDLLKRRIAANAAATTSEGICRYFADRIALAALPAGKQASPYIQRVRFLTANASDVRRLRELSEAALASLDEVCGEIDRRIVKIRGREDMVIIGLPAKLRQLARSAAYKRAWVRLYLGMTLADPAGGDDRRRRRLLTDAMDDVAAYADAPDDRSGVKYASLLLRGTAAGRLGSGEAARRCLQAASSAEAPAGVRMAAMFELARQAIDAGRWDPAARRTADFAARAPSLVAADQRVGVDVYAAMLTERLLRRRAAQTLDAAQADTWNQRADRTLADLLGRHDDRLASVCATLARPSSDQTDVASLPGPVAFARGVTLAAAADGEAAAVECFRSVLGRSDPVSRDLAGACLWRLASTLYKQGRRQGAAGWPLRRQAAEQFALLARTHPTDERADQAAVNAVRIYGARVAALERAAHAVGPDLREAYAAALELTVTGPADRDDALGYTYQLARQLRLLGRTDAAIRWYSRIGKSSGDYVGARFNELTLRTQGLGELSGRAQSDAAEALIAAWGDLARIAARRADAATDPGQVAEHLAVAGAAEYRIAEVLADPLGRGEKAVGHCTAAAERWKGRPKIADRLEGLRIELLLRQGKLRDAVAALDRFGAADAATTSRLAVLAAAELGKRIDTTVSPTEVPAEQAPLRSAYLRYAQRACAVMASRSAEARYLFRQMLAEATAEAGRPAEALKIFARLVRSRPDDANNIQGRARCHWLAGRHVDAIGLYRQFVSGVDITKHPDRWWRGQLALARCVYDQAAGDRSQLRRLAVRLEQLRLRDGSYGGHAEAFERLRRKIDADSTEE